MRQTRTFSLLSTLVLLATAWLAVALLPPPLARVRRSIGDVECRAAVRGNQLMATWARDLYLAWTLRPHLASACSQLGAEGSSVVAVVPHQPHRAGPWIRLGPGLRLRTVTMQSGTRVHQIMLDPARARLKVLYARDYGIPHSTVEDLARRAGAMVAINASYFDENRTPLGYLKINGRLVVGAVATGAAFTGVLVVRHGRPCVVGRDGFDGHGSEVALQAGPRLVAGGQATAGLREHRSFRQSGIAVTRTNKVVIYATDGPYTGLTWDEVRRLLLGPPDQGGIDPLDVLNLDGGSSSQLFVQRSGGPLCTGFPTHVPVALGLFPGK